MAYALSFAPEFFWGDGPLRPSSHPTSVYQALLGLTPEQWTAIARDVFHCSPDHLDERTVLDRIFQTNTCRNLDSPVEVFVDPEGLYVVRVYEPRKEGP